MIEYEKDAIVQPYVTEYIRSEIRENIGILAELEKYASEHEVPIVQPETAKLLEVLTAAKQPHNILEIGTAIGYSAILMSEICPEARITTLEFDGDMASLARDNVARAGLSEKIEVIFADARDYISYIDRDGYYDMIFIDGPKAHYVYMIDDCMRLLKKSGVMICDNVLYKGMTCTDELVIRRKITIVKRLRKFIKAISERDDMVTSVLSVGDGVTVSVKLK